MQDTKLPLAERVRRLRLQADAGKPVQQHLAKIDEMLRKVEEKVANGTQLREAA